MIDFPQVLRMEIGSPNAGLLYSRLIPLVLLFVDGNHQPTLSLSSHLELFISLASTNEIPVHSVDQAATRLMSLILTGICIS